ncbi:hypothetical protein HAT86_15620 [Roseovarius gahaiensis]|uniref:Uncharacterized protein n=1 Tax=Roseovarius gahaiensis TaxID=2716691 RepID=A0A967BFE0_9RHOB|nr:hypothetical protein [Roseovarius gahaiensis]NHQ75878.1 hypothetical protein [Roseovarius gahaiensis]
MLIQERNCSLSISNNPCAQSAARHTHEILQMLWREHDVAHAEFHPHVADLAPFIQGYLRKNLQTKHLKIEVDKLGGLLNDLDLTIFNARLEDNEQWGTPFYYKKLKKMLQGYLITCE